MSKIKSSLDSYMDIGHANDSTLWFLYKGKIIKKDSGIELSTNPPYIQHNFWIHKKYKDVDTSHIWAGRFDKKTKLLSIRAPLEISDTKPSEQLIRMLKKIFPQTKGIYFNLKLLREKKMKKFKQFLNESVFKDKKMEYKVWKNPTKQELNDLITYDREWHDLQNPHIEIDEFEGMRFVWDDKNQDFYIWQGFLQHDTFMQNLHLNFKIALDGWVSFRKRLLMWNGPHVNKIKEMVMMIKVARYFNEELHFSMRIEK